MKRSRFTRPSPAMIVACAALFVALGGSSYAALLIGSGNIKTGAVNTRTLKNNDIRGKDVRTGTLSSADLGDSGKPLRRFGPTSLSLNQQTTLFAYGGFQFIGQCNLAPGNATRFRVVLIPAENGTAFGSPSNDQGLIGPTTPEALRVVRTTTAPIGQFRHSNAENDGFSAVAPSGRAIDGAIHAAVNGQNRTCRSYGDYVRIK